MGLRQDISTVTNLLEALNVLTEALMHRHPIDVIYLDYAKSVDTVPHQRLLRQIYTLEVTIDEKDLGVTINNQLKIVYACPDSSSQC